MPKARPARRFPTIVFVLGLMAALCGGSCQNEAPEAPTPPGSTLPTPGTGSGLVRIQFLSATPEPGATVAGCGDQIAGCVGRIRMRFRLTPAATGSALFTRGWLFAAANLRACLSFEGGPLLLTAGASQDIDVSFDRADQCSVPIEINNMAFVIEGTVQVSSRQEWSVRYAFVR